MQLNCSPEQESFFVTTAEDLPDGRQVMQAVLNPDLMNIRIFVYSKHSLRETNYNTSVEQDILADHLTLKSLKPVAIKVGKPKA